MSAEAQRPEETPLPGGFLPPVPAPGPPVSPRESPRQPGRGAAAPRVVPASWWSRAAAAILDALIVGLGAAIVLSVLDPGLVDSIEGDVASLRDLGITMLTVAAVALLYAPLLMARTNGQTLGKMAVRIRVVRVDGRRMTFAWAAMREVLVKSLGLGVASSATFGLVTFADYLWPLWDAERRALHDHVARTRVVRG